MWKDERRREYFPEEVHFQEKKVFAVSRLTLATIVAAFFAILFLMPIVLTITNSFMSASEIASNYGTVFATNSNGGRFTYPRR